MIKRIAVGYLVLCALAAYTYEAITHGGMMLGMGITLVVIGITVLAYLIGCLVVGG